MSDTLGGGADDDLIIGFNGADLAFSGAGNDTVGAGDGNDTIYGGGGDDSLGGEGNQDLIFNGEGSDTVYGGVSEDTLWGGAGDDLLHGGDIGGLPDASDGDGDVFAFEAGNGNDTIGDFEDDLDQILINGFAFADLSISDDGTDALIAFDDVTITVIGQTADQLNEDDFIFI